MLSGALTLAETQRLTVSAVFGDIDDDEPGAGIDIPAPTIPPPDECVNRAELLQGVALPIASRIDVRVPADSAVAGKSNRAITEGWVRLRDGTPPTVLSLPLFADAFPPSLFAKLGSVVARSRQLGLLLET